MKLMKIFELTTMMLMMGFLLGLSPYLLFLIPLYGREMRKILRQDRQKHQEKETLHQLSELSSLLEQGDSPLFAYEKLGRFTFPDFMLHPEEEVFRHEVYQKQFQLFEKTVLLKEEMENEMAVVRLRMGIMKLMPLVLLLLIRRFMGVFQPPLINVLTVLFFLVSHWIAEKILEKL